MLEMCSLSRRNRTINKPILKYETTWSGLPIANARDLCIASDIVWCESEESGMRKFRASFLSLLMFAINHLIASYLIAFLLM